MGQPYFTYDVYTLSLGCASIVLLSHYKTTSQHPVESSKLSTVSNEVKYSVVISRQGPCDLVCPMFRSHKGLVVHSWRASSALILDGVGNV